MFGSNLMISQMRWKLKYLQVVSRPWDYKWASSTNHWGKRCSNFSYEWWSTRPWQSNTGHQIWDVTLQAQRDVYQAELQRCPDTINHLKTRYVPHARDPGKDNIIIILRKHTISANGKHYDLPYCIARIQRRKRYVKLRWSDRHFPDHEVIVEIENPNSIHAFNQFEEKGNAEWKYNHFRQIDLTREELYTMGVPAILDEEEE